MVGLQSSCVDVAMIVLFCSPSLACHGVDFILNREGEKQHFASPTVVLRFAFFALRFVPHISSSSSHNPPGLFSS